MPGSGVMLGWVIFDDLLVADWYGFGGSLVNWQGTTPWGYAVPALPPDTRHLHGLCHMYRLRGE